MSGQSWNISANMDPHIVPYLEDLVSGYTFVSAAWDRALNGANVVISLLYLLHSLWNICLFLCRYTFNHFVCGKQGDMINSIAVGYIGT